MCPAQAVKGPCAEPDPFWGAKLLGAPERPPAAWGCPQCPFPQLLCRERRKISCTISMLCLCAAGAAVVWGWQGSGSSCFSQCLGRPRRAASPQGAQTCLEMPLPKIDPKAMSCWQIVGNLRGVYFKREVWEFATCQVSGFAQTLAETRFFSESDFGGCCVSLKGRDR